MNIIFEIVGFGLWLFTVLVGIFYDTQFLIYTIAIVTSMSYLKLQDIERYIRK